MGIKIVVQALALALLGACGGDPASARAEAAFAAFQAALQRGDAEAARQLVTLESAPALADLDWANLRTQPPLEVVGSEPRSAEFRLRVRQAGAPQSAGEFVVVREHGRYVVDLVATAGLYTEIVEATSGREEFVPQELSPRDLDRIRAIELAKPATATRR